MAKNKPIKKDRYYYTKDGKPAYNIKESIESLLGKDAAKDYVEITKEEWESLHPQRPEPTPEQIAKREKLRQIAQLKDELAKTDYVVVKIAESDDPDEIAALREEYATVIAHRKELRAQINELEGELE